MKDYFRRIQDHEKFYEPVEETTWPFIRIINVRHDALDPPDLPDLIIR